MNKYFPSSLYCRRCVSFGENVLIVNRVRTPKTIIIYSPLCVACVLVHQYRSVEDARASTSRLRRNELQNQKQNRNKKTKRKRAKPNTDCPEWQREKFSLLVDGHRSLLATFYIQNNRSTLCDVFFRSNFSFVFATLAAAAVWVRVCVCVCVWVPQLVGICICTCKNKICEKGKKRHKQSHWTEWTEIVRRAHWQTIL